MKDRSHERFLSRYSGDVDDAEVIVGWDPGYMGYFAQVWLPDNRDEPTHQLGLKRELATVDALADALGPYGSVALENRDDLEQDREWAIRLYGPSGGPAARDPEDREILIAWLEDIRS
jgi:hypothetical protein